MSEEPNNDFGRALLDLRNKCSAGGIDTSNCRFGVDQPFPGRPYLFPRIDLKSVSTFEVVLKPGQQVTRKFTWTWREPDLSYFVDCCEEWLEAEDVILSAEGYLDLGCAYAWLGPRYYSKARSAWATGLDSRPSNQTREMLLYNRITLDRTDPKGCADEMATECVKAPELFATMPRQSREAHRVFLTSSDK